MHLALSVGFALAFASLASSLVTIEGVTNAGIAFGAVLWLADSLVRGGSIMGWALLPARGDPLIQLLANSFFYGYPLGWYLGRPRLCPPPPKKGRLSQTDIQE